MSPAELEQQLEGITAANDDIALGEPPSTDPATGKPELSPQEKDHLEAVGFAAMLTEMGAQVVARRWPQITFSNAEKEQVCGKVVPVLKKYNIGSAFMEKYKEEFALGATLVGLFIEKKKRYDELNPAAARGDQGAEKKKPDEPAPGEGDPHAFLRRA